MGKVTVVGGKVGMEKPIVLPPKGKALNNYTWEEIRTISDAGKASEYFKVGDKKTIVINGNLGVLTVSKLNVDVFIIGINHNSDREGDRRIHFQIGKISNTLIAFVDSKYNYDGTSGLYFKMNYNNTNAGGWSGCSMRDTLLGNSGTPTNPITRSVMSALPSDLRAVMKSVTKYSDNTGGGSDNASYVTATNDYLFLLSEYEYLGVRTYANSAEKNYQAQYEYYKAGNSARHMKHNDRVYSASVVNCRSVNATQNNQFCALSTDGTYSSTQAIYSRGISPAFCV